MWKVFTGVILGVFVGAMAFEILKRRNPKLLGDIEDKARRVVRATADAFAEGYHKPREAVDVSPDKG